MILSFKNKATENIFDGKTTKNTRNICPQNLLKIARRKLDQIDSIIELDELRIPPGNRFEMMLGGDRKNEYSIRINDQYRICFVWHGAGAELVEITDYH